ncbi:DNA/RNA non-specific endonuclease [Thermoactinomyces intermedius]|uniref:DNA/RNA non-specific endonuclease n=1 Tax=Thermoactinomyces intermedius TaxID=2024 RepID=A0A8I1A3V6_THEIN|nr:DNA/RNA non-specific endonuclease [Thermoactinomyces intermedius]MBA4836123.1 DNA/RNA non-specific endonuclease [Thermoactinomyces intermedius]MBH8594319.1 DNA/RNA non-specific endonuclease [Thermoactinomyces intermedius]
MITDGSHINPNGTLRPNIRYRTGEYDYIYETDDLGRIIEFNADDLRLTQRTERLPHNQNTPGKLPTDHAGHLAGDRFGGSPELDNLVSMSRSANLSVYKRLENRWARALENGQQVSVRVRINYDGNNMRPSSFDVQYTIDGVGFEQHIPN